MVMVDQVVAADTIPVLAELDLKAAMVKEIPVGRAGTPDDVSAAVAYFVRDDAAFVSGQVLYVAGGPRA